MAKELIYRDDAYEAVRQSEGAYSADLLISDIPAVDAVPVVRCRECEYGVEAEDDGFIQCVVGANLDESTGVWIGFCSWNEPDWFCKGGKRREDGDT